MIKSILAAGLLAVAFAAPASADIVRCNKATLGMIHDEAAKMTGADQQEAMKMTMDELEMAMGAKGKKDIKGCRMHAAMAIDHLHGK